MFFPAINKSNEPPLQLCRRIIFFKLHKITTTW